VVLLQTLRALAELMVAIDCESLVEAQEQSELGGADMSTTYCWGHANGNLQVVEPHALSSRMHPTGLMQVFHRVLENGWSLAEAAQVTANNSSAGREAQEVTGLVAWMPLPSFSSACGWLWPYCVLSINRYTFIGSGDGVARGTGSAA
jgi:hypothetical protein